jgi:hypothetical protein
MIAGCYSTYHTLQQQTAAVIKLQAVHSQTQAALKHA